MLGTVGVAVLAVVAGFGLGRAAPNPVLSVMKYFEKEVS